MFELFPDQPLYEYPQIINVSYSFLWAFVLSSIIAITHRLTFTGDYYPKNFFQALVLGSLITTLVMLAIGDSLARGLGVFGAMAIIRFRTRIEDPRDVLFLFAALSTGLAIGVFGFTISFVGSLLFCAVAFLLHYSSFRSYSQHTHLFFTLESEAQLPEVIRVVSDHCADYRLVSLTVNKENALRYQYAVSFRRKATKEALMSAMRKLDIVRQARITSNEIEVNR
jgi:signal transduction histidine kinase